MVDDLFVVVGKDAGFLRKEKGEAKEKATGKVRGKINKQLAIDNLIDKEELYFMRRDDFSIFVLRRWSAIISTVSGKFGKVRREDTVVRVALPHIARVIRSHLLSVSSCTTLKAMGLLFVVKRKL